MKVVEQEASEVNNKVMLRSSGDRIFRAGGSSSGALAFIASDDTYFEKVRIKSDLSGGDRIFVRGTTPPPGAELG